MSKSTILAQGVINLAGDRITVELVAPNNHPPMIRVVWRAKVSIIEPHSFNRAAGEIAQLFALGVRPVQSDKGPRAVSRKVDPWITLAAILIWMAATNLLAVLVGNQ
jgi:hypothetical protein